MSFVFLGPHPQHMEIPRLEVKSELKLQAYTRAAATWDESCVFDPHHSSRPRWILSPLSEARDRTCDLMAPSGIHFHYATMGTPTKTYYFNFSPLTLIWHWQSPTQKLLRAHDSLEKWVQACWYLSHTLCPSSQVPQNTWPTRSANRGPQHVCDAQNLCSPSSRLRPSHSNTPTRTAAALNVKMLFILPNASSSLRLWKAFPDP